MDYESAPATQLLATNCAACSRPLLDAISVETGMGPICREKYGYTQNTNEENRNAANKIVHNSAARQEITVEEIKTLISLGFAKLAVKVAQNLANLKIVKVTENQDTYTVNTPYNPDTLDAWRRIPGRRWDKDNKANTVPKSSKRDLWALIQRFYQGNLLESNQGVTLIK